MRAHAGAAASVSGVGEQVMQALLARRVCLGLISAGRPEAGAAEGGEGGEGGEGEAVHECAARLLGDSLRHECGPSNREPAAGAIAVRVGSGPASGPAAGLDLELLWAHNTPSFAVGYYHHGLEQPCAFVSRASGNGQPLVSGTYVA